MDIIQYVAAMSDAEVLAYVSKTKIDNYTKYTLAERMEWAKSVNNKEEFLHNRALNKAILKRQKELLTQGKDPVNRDETRSRRS